jgi:organic hydroperoxide reductase OsmC/OhrA
MLGTYAAGLAARGIDASENLVGEVEGDIAEVDGVIRIAAIRLHMTASVPEEEHASAERLLSQFPAGCPAYQSVCGSIAISCTATFT